MARKVDSARRAELLCDVLSVLRKQGIHGTSMSQLAETLGMKRSTFYWYFKDIGELFDAAFDDVNQRFLNALTEPLARTVHPIDMLETYLEIAVSHFQDSRDEIILLFQLWASGRARDPDQVLERGRQFLTPLRAALVEILRKGQAAGQVAPCDPEGLIDSMLALVYGTLVHRVARNADLSALLATVKTQFLRPLRL